MEKKLSDDEVCMMCRREEAANRNLEINLDKIFEFIKKAVHGTNAAKLGCCELLASLLNHMSFAVLKQYESEMLCTLILMKETDEDLRSEFQYVVFKFCSFSIIVKNFNDNSTKSLSPRI